MQFKQLKYFVASAEEGSLSKAARVVHIAQPALSQQILKLENSLSVKLFERSTSGVKTTAAGDTLLHHARQILKSVEQARHDVTVAGNEVKGEVSVALPNMISAAITPHLLQMARGKYPGLSLRIQEGNSLVCQELIENARVDLGIIPDGESDAKIEGSAVLKQNIYLVGAVVNDFGVEPSDADINFKDAAKYPLAVIEKPHSLRLELESRAADSNISLNVVAQSSSSAITRHFVSGGVAFSFLPWLSFHEKMKTGELFARRIVEPEMIRKYMLCWPKARPMNKPTLAVAELIRNVCGDWATTVVTSQQIMRHNSDRTR